MTKRKQKTMENDFEALDQPAQGLSPEKMRPLSAQMRRRWQQAKRGRPRKAAGTKAVPTMITVEPGLLKQIDAQAKKSGLSRSGLIAQAMKRYMQHAA